MFQVEISLCNDVDLSAGCLSHLVLTHGSSQIIKGSSNTGSQDVIYCAGLQVANTVCVYIRIIAENQMFFK